jgi:drug/metabolite transporter (DMT)-like permease
MRSRGLLFCLIPPILWGGMLPVADSIAATVDSFSMTLIRYTAAAVVLAVLLARAEGLRAFRLDGRGWRLALLGASGFAGFGLLAFTALRFTSAPNVSLMMGMMPAIGAVLASIGARRLPPAATVGCILLALVGVALVVTRGDVALLLDGELGFGELLALLGAICWVVYTRGAAAFPGWSALRYSTLTTALGCPSIALAVAVATATGSAHPPTGAEVLAAWPQLVYLILLAGVVAVLLWNTGIKLLGALNGTLFQNLVPVTTFAISMAGGYRPGPVALLGAAIVVTALLLNNWATRRAAAVAAHPVPVAAPVP